MENRQTKVVALRYDPACGLPQLVFKGAGPLADEVVRRSIQGRGPKIFKDEGLVDRLYRLPVDAPIGADLFRAVAIVLAHLLAIEASVNERNRDV